MWDQARPERAGRSNTVEMTRLDQTGTGEVYHCLNTLGPLSPAPEKDHFLVVFLLKQNKEKLFSGLGKSPSEVLRCEKTGENTSQARNSDREEKDQGRRGSFSNLLDS